jgi:hypothetical protein
VKSANAGIYIDGNNTKVVLENKDLLDKKTQNRFEGTQNGDYKSQFQSYFVIRICSFVFDIFFLRTQDKMVVRYSIQRGKTK